MRYNTNRPPVVANWFDAWLLDAAAQLGVAVSSLHWKVSEGTDFGGMTHYVPGGGSFGPSSTVENMMKLDVTTTASSACHVAFGNVSTAPLTTPTGILRAPSRKFYIRTTMAVPVLPAATSTAIALAGWMTPSVAIGVTPAVAMLSVGGALRYAFVGATTKAISLVAPTTATRDIRGWHVPGTVSISVNGEAAVSVSDAGMANNTAYCLGMGFQLVAGADNLAQSALVGRSLWAWTDEGV